MKVEYLGRFQRALGFEETASFSKTSVLLWWFSKSCLCSLECISEWDVAANHASPEVRVYTFLRAARPEPGRHFRVFSAVKRPSHWHSGSDEPAERQWSHLMERHGNSRHLAGVHPPPPLSGMLEHISLRPDWKPPWTNNGCTPV